MRTDTGDDAFPMQEIAKQPRNHGMTLLDYFAGQALAGCLAYSYVNPLKGNYHENSTPQGVAISAYEYAAAMIAEKRRRENS